MTNPPTIAAQAVREAIADLHNNGAEPTPREIAAAAIASAAWQLLPARTYAEHLLRRAFCALAQELRGQPLPDASREALAEQFPALQPAPQQATAEPSPAPQGITLEDLVEAIHSARPVQRHRRYSEAIAEHLIDHSVVGPLLRVEALPPIPASERPWERPGWCDSEGRCWGFNATERGWRLRPAAWFQSGADRIVWRWLLPASTIPVPAEEGQS